MKSEWPWRDDLNRTPYNYPLMSEGLNDESSTEAGAAARIGRWPIVELLFLAGPTVAQQLSYTLMQFVDTWMLARYHRGFAEPVAVGNSGLFAFSIISLGIGTIWVVNTLVSQSFGRRHYRACGTHLWQGVWVGVVFFALILPLLPYASHVFEWMGHDPGLVRLETLYLRIVLAAAIFKLIGVAFGQFLLAINRPGRVFLASFIGVGVNVAAAWALIFGHLGSRPMGVAGAAWGQNIGVFVEMGVLIFFATRPKVRRIFGVGNWRPRWDDMKTMLRIGIPSGVQVLSDVLAWSMFSLWVMGLFGTKVMAANTFAIKYWIISFMPAFGVATAVTSLVGRYIGMQQFDLARQRANLGFAVTCVYMMVCGTVFVFMRYQLMGSFTDDAEIIAIGANVLLIAVAYQLFDAMYFIYIGALRGAGDTFVPALVSGLLCWGVTVAGGYAVGRLFPQWGSWGPWCMMSIYIITIGTFIFIRFQRGGWRRIHLEEPDAPSDLSGQAQQRIAAVEGTP